MGGFLGIGHLPGEASAKRALGALNNQAAMFDAWNKRYYEPALAALWQQYQNPNSPYRQAQFNQAAAGAWGDYARANQQLNRSLQQRGLGQSSQTMQGLGGLANAYGQTLANLRMQRLGQNEQAQQQALAQLMGGINPQAAAELYGQMYQNAMGQQQGFMNTMGGLGTVAGRLGWLA